MTCSTRVTLTTAKTMVPNSPMMSHHLPPRHPHSTSAIAPAVSPLSLSVSSSPSGGGGGKSSSSSCATSPYSPYSPYAGGGGASSPYVVSPEYSCEFESAGYLIAEAEAAAAGRGLHGPNPPPGTLITSNNPKVNTYGNIITLVALPSFTLFTPFAPYLFLHRLMIILFLFVTLNIFLYLPLLLLLLLLLLPFFQVTDLSADTRKSKAFVTQLLSRAAAATAAAATAAAPSPHSSQKGMVERIMVPIGGTPYPPPPPLPSPQTPSALATPSSLRPPPLSIPSAMPTSPHPNANASALLSTTSTNQSGGPCSFRAIVEFVHSGSRIKVENEMINITQFLPFDSFSFFLLAE